MSNPTWTTRGGAAPFVNTKTPRVGTPVSRVMNASVRPSGDLVRPEGCGCQIEGSKPSNASVSRALANARSSARNPGLPESRKACSGPTCLVLARSASQDFAPSTPTLTSNSKQAPQTTKTATRIMALFIQKPVSRPNAKTHWRRANDAEQANRCRSRRPVK